MGVSHDDSNHPVVRNIYILKSCVLRHSCIVWRMSIQKNLQTAALEALSSFYVWPMWFCGILGHDGIIECIVNNSD